METIPSAIELRRLTRETDDGIELLRRRPCRLTEFDYEGDNHAEHGLDE